MHRRAPPSAFCKLPFPTAVVNTAARFPATIGYRGPGLLIQLAERSYCPRSVRHWSRTQRFASRQASSVRLRFSQLRSAVGGIHRCAERQFRRAVGRCNRHQEENCETRIGVNHLVQLGTVRPKLGSDTPWRASTSRESSSCVTTVSALAAPDTPTDARSDGIRQKPLTPRPR